MYTHIYMSPGGSDDKERGRESTCNAGDLGSISGLERSPGEGNGNPLQYSCLEKPHGQKQPGRLQSTGVTNNWTQLSD